MLNDHEIHVMPPDGGRMFVTGDLHGAYKPLMEALKAVDFDMQRDHLFCVGDLIDRGPDNYDMLELFDKEPNFHSVRGNHEQMIVDGDVVTHTHNGGEWYYRLDRTEQDYVDAVCKSLPVAMTVISPSKRRIGIVHADVAGADWAEFVQNLSDGHQAVHAYAQWSHKGIQQASEGVRMAHVKSVDLVYMGHTPKAAPLRAGNRVWLDTGAYYRNHVYLEEVL